jgi:hypothetical protein
MSTFHDPTRPIFNAETAQAFLAMVSDPTYNKKARPSQEQCNRMLDFVLNRSLPYLPPEKKLAHRSRTQFSHSDGRLFANPCLDFPRRRLVLLDGDIIDLVARVHRQHLHAGADTVYRHIVQHYYGIKRDEVRWLLPFCLPCQDERAAASAPAPLQPIESSCPFERVQIDLIDRRLTPDTSYTWILHAKDHFSKVTALYPLLNREAMTVAVAFRNWIMAYGPPKIVQCDNGTEFQGKSSTALILLFRFYGCSCSTC